MPKQKYLRLDLARQQLQTAVSLFLGKDYLSVITLAGAASGVLTQLVLNSGKEPFVDYGRTFQSSRYSQATPGREKYNRFINSKVGVDVLRHHAANDPETIELNAELQAEHALSRAVVDYIELRGQDEPFVQMFLKWLWVNRDGPKEMAEFEAEDKRFKKRRPR
jgi:hypothetical protein